MLLILLNLPLSNITLVFVFRGAHLHSKIFFKNRFDYISQPFQRLAKASLSIFSRRTILELEIFVKLFNFFLRSNSSKIDTNR